MRPGPVGLIPNLSVMAQTAWLLAVQCPLHRVLPCEHLGLHRYGYFGRRRSIHLHEVLLLSHCWLERLVGRVQRRLDAFHSLVVDDRRRAVVVARLPSRLLPYLAFSVAEEAGVKEVAGVEIGGRQTAN